MNILKYLQKYSWCNSIIKLHLNKNTALLAPYHNFNHALVVTENTIAAAQYYNINEINLICAALFHDFNHSQGVEKDSINVLNAQHSFVTWWETHRLIYPEINPNSVIALIAATEYPYVISVDDLSLEQKIIRDCDLLQSIEKNRFSQVHLGLSKEMNINLSEYLINSIKFINNVVPNTDWMQKIWIQHKNQLLDELHIIQKIIIDNE